MDLNDRSRRARVWPMTFGDMLSVAESMAGQAGTCHAVLRDDRRSGVAGVIPALL